MADGQLSLTLRGAGYPKRPAFFANKFLRLLAKVCAAQEIGCEGYCVLSLVAQIEDSRRYSSPPTFYDEQLRSTLGLSKKQLYTARKKCVEAGWLHYEPGCRRRPGLYWVVVPDCFDLIDDSPLGESPMFRFPQGTETEPKRNRNGIESEPKRNPSLPIPKPKSPTPIPDEDEAVRQRLKEAGVDTFVETFETARENGLTLEQIHAVISHYLSRPNAWGLGALVKRLTSRSAPFLSADKGWPTPSPKEGISQRLACAAAESQENQERKKQRKSREAELRQLELQFGERVDSLSTAQLVELLERHGRRAAVPFLHRHGPKAAIVRADLLRAFSERYGSN